MNFRATVILLLILALLGGYYYFYEVKFAAKQAKIEEDKKKLFLFSEQDVQEIKLIGPEGTIVAKKSDGGWTLEEPIQAKADDKAVESLINRLKNAQSDRSVDEGTPKLADYGLVKPFLQVSLKLKDQSTYQTLYLGDLTPTELYVYAQRNVDPKIYLIDKFLRDDLNKKVFDLRDKTIVAFETDKVKKLEFTVDKNKMVAEATGGDWKVTQPGEYKGDKDRITSILTKLNFTRIKEFIEENPEDLSKYGLDNPPIQVTLWVGDDMAQKTLLLGKSDESKKGIYAKREGTHNVFLVPDDLTKDFPKTVMDLRDKTVLAFEKGDIKKVQIQREGMDLIAEKVSDKDWNLTQPEQVKADESAISDILTEVRGLKVKEFTHDNPQDLATYGLNTPKIQVNLWEKDKENPKTLWVGKEEGSGVYVKTNESNSVYLVDSTIVKTLTKTPMDLRDKTLVSFNREDVEKITLKYPDKTFTFQKSGKEWRLVEPEKAKAKDWRVGNLLTDLQFLKFKELVPKDQMSDGDYGFDKPEVEITLWKKGDEEITTLILGKKTDNGLIYTRTKSGDVIYRIDAGFLQELPKSVEEVKA